MRRRGHREGVSSPGGCNAHVAMSMWDHKWVWQQDGINVGS